MEEKDKLLCRKEYNLCMMQFIYVYSLFDVLNVVFIASEADV